MNGIMQGNQGGLALVGGLLAFMFLGGLLGHQLGERAGIEASIKVAIECESERSYSEYEKVSDCMQDLYDLAKEEEYAEGAAEQYP